MRKKLGMSFFVVIATVFFLCICIAACGGKDQTPKILSVRGGEISNNDIFIFVDKDTTDLSLADKIDCSKGSIWQLYSDPEGQSEIPTKIVANLDGGDNKYYIVVQSQDRTQVNVYKLIVHRSHLVNISYYSGTYLLKTESAYTGEEFATSYRPELAGYAFHGWEKQDGTAFVSEVLWAPLSLYADKTAYTYQVTLDENGGDELPETEKTLAFGSAYIFPVPVRTGYSFVGWYFGDERLTDENGSSLGVWDQAREIQLMAHWKANKYVVTLQQDDKSAGTVSGEGVYAYDSQVTIKATTNEGYNFLGWFDKDGELVSEQSDYTFIMGLEADFTAKWNYYTLSTTCNNEHAGELEKEYSAEKVSVGTKVTLKAITNTGYTFCGWYKDEEQISGELALQITMGKENVTYEARWIECPVAVSSSNETCGTVDGLPATTILGQQIELKATEVKLGYQWLGWFLNNNFLTKEYDYKFILSAEPDQNYVAKYVIDAAMINFEFTSTVTSCKIISVKDKATEKIVVPDYVTELERSAFFGCNCVTSVTIPFVGTRSDGSEDTRFYDVFHGDNGYSVPDSLKEVIVTRGTSIGSYAFFRCAGLTSITIPDSVTMIEDGAFAWCSGLKQINIPNGVTSIGDSSFRQCIGLTKIEIPSSVERIGEWAFADCSALLGELQIPEKVKTIPAYAFFECKKLESVIIGSGVKSIGSYAFAFCAELQSITIPDSVTSIGEEAFRYCSGLTSITYNGTVSEWQNIEKGTGWDYYTGDYIVTCTDGTITKYGTVTMN